MSEPSVLAHEPTLLTTDPNAVIRVWFSEYLTSAFDVELQLIERFTLIESDEARIAVSGTQTVVDNIITFEPGAPLNPRSLYQVLVVNRNPALNRIEPFEFVFTVKTTEQEAGECATIYDTFEAITGQANPTIPAAGDKPERGQVYGEPTFDTCNARVSDVQVDPVRDSFCRHQYSRRQAFNADNTLAFFVNGRENAFLYNLETTSFLRQLPTEIKGDAAEFIWHDSNPDIGYFMDFRGGDKLYQIDVSTDTITTVADLAGRIPFGGTKLWSRGEGTPSRNTRYWCWVIEDSSSNELGVMVYDLVADTVLATKTIGDLGVSGIDNTSMSASGNFALIMSASSGMYTDRLLNNPSIFLPRSQHSDIGLLDNGDDCVVTVDYDSNNGDVFFVNLNTNARTFLFPIYLNGSSTAIHFSLKNYLRPGWTLMSTYANSSGKPVEWHHRKVFVVELKENPRILQIAHHQAQENGFWTEPHATVNRDFTQLFFASNWGTPSTTEIESYRIRMPTELLT